MFEERVGQDVKRNGSVLKTFRLPKSLESVLELEAKARGLSLNALASTVFTKFVQWDRFAARFGYLAITHETLRALLDLADDEHLTEAAQKVGAQIPNEAVLFWFKKVNVDTFLAYLENVCKFGGHAEYECQNSGGDYSITLRHDHGIKWSKWLKYSLDGALRKMLGVSAQFETTESEVICRFYAPRGDAKQQLIHMD
jgi:hypothetical protein